MTNNLSANVSKQKCSGNVSSGDILWIDDEVTLADFCKDAGREEFVCIDTEFHRDKTFYAQLALVQVAAGKTVACIDPLAIKDLSPLDELLMKEEVIKIFHAGRQDLEVFFDRLGQVPMPIFDTQIAASLLGMGEQTGYANLVKKMCSITLDKAHVRADWMRRPLDDGVIAYAADDVRYLPEIYLKLKNKLTTMERMSWLDEEQSVLCDPATYNGNRSKSLEKVKGTKSLSGISLATADLLAVWREDVAMKENRPRRWILSDENIVNIARQRPRNKETLGCMRGFEESKSRRYGDKLISIVKEAENIPQDQWPARTEGKYRDELFDDALLEALVTVLKVQAKNNDVSVALLASKSDLQKAACGDRKIKLFNGWRNTLAGNTLSDFIDGKLSMQIEAGRLVLKSR